MMAAIDFIHQHPGKVLVLQCFIPGEGSHVFLRSCLSEGSPYNSHGHLPSMSTEGSDDY